MLEIRDEIGIEYETLPELLRRRDMGRQSLDDLTRELNRLSSQVEEKATLLKQLNKERLVREREIKDNQNRIFYIREEVSKLDGDAYRLQREYEKRADELARLRSEKEKIGDSIIKTEKGILDVSDRLATLEKEKEQTVRRLEEQREEKQTVSDNISNALTNTSLDREDVEARMQELNTLFLARIQERNAVSERLSELEMAEKTLLEDINNLEHERDLLDRVKILQSERDAHKPVVERLQEEKDQILSNLAHLQEILEGRQDAFDSLSTRNCEIKEEIASLEKEVAEYDEALEKRSRAQEERDRTLETIEKDLEEIRALFSSRRELQTALLLTDEKIKALEEVNLSIG